MRGQQISIAVHVGDDVAQLRTVTEFHESIVATVAIEAVTFPEAPGPPVLEAHIFVVEDHGDAWVVGEGDNDISSDARIAVGGSRFPKDRYTLDEVVSHAEAMMSLTVAMIVPQGRALVAPQE